MVATDLDLRILNPYKSHVSSVNQVSATPQYKMDSMDILWSRSAARVFWTDIQKKKISTMIIDISVNTRVKRDQAREPRDVVCAELCH